MNRTISSTGECGVGGLVTQITSPGRLGNQTASGDTGDNSACEQTKRSFVDDSNSNKTTYSQSTNHTLSSNTNTYSANSQIPAPRYNTPTNIAPSTVAENKTNLIINYLPPNMSQEEVRALFSSVGEVESCKLVREKTSGESLGYAFVKFYDPVDAGKAIKTLNGLRLQNKTVKVSLARPSSEAIKGANLYICGLPRKMTQTELEKLFGTCGHIITARILYDTKTGLSRGVAFIRYDQRAEAEVAIKKLNGYLPPGATEQITVKFANSPSANRTENNGTGYMRALDAENGSKYAVSSSSNPVTGLDLGSLKEGSNTGRSVNPNNGPQTSQSPPTVAAQNRSVHGGIGLMYPNQQLTNSTGCAITCNPICPYPNGVDANGSQGNSVESHTTAFPNNFPLPLPSHFPGSSNGTGHRLDTGLVNSMHRAPGAQRFKGHTVNTAAIPSGGGLTGFRSSQNALNGTVPPTFPTGLPAFGVDFMRNLGPSAQALLAPAFAAGSGALTANGWCIFVYNLAPDTEESMLWQLFGPFGAVQTVKVIRDPVTSKCRGFGFVTMSNYEEAVLAIHSLNGFHLGNRVLQVSFKTTPNSKPGKYTTDVTPDMALMASFPGSVTPVPGSFAKHS